MYDKSRLLVLFIYCLIFNFQGAMKLGRLAKSMAVGVNVKRRAKGLLPRPVGIFTNM